MCGIAGILINSRTSESLTASGGYQHIKKMTAALAHRGPDGEGFWVNPTENIFLGHRRLAVIDLSSNASQPMHFNNGSGIHPRYTIVHNGEIYNYIELRTILQHKGYTFHSQSDTEVILAAYDLWKERCLQHFEGMFAFAIWDEKEQRLFAARDRLGEKPFYYYEDEGHFIFASEMKALWAIGIQKTMNEKMLLNYLALGHVQNSMDKESTFYKNIYTLPPAHYLYAGADDLKSEIFKYWSINKEIKIEISVDDAVERFAELFNNAVQKRMRSNVAVGASLSGGIDSSSIIYSMLRGQNDIRGTAQKGSPLKTFSAVFSGFKNDESAYIATMSDKYGIENHQVSPSASDLISDFETLCFHQEEPFPSSGIYAQYKVFEKAGNNGVKVLLDGQGADEILAGYPRYVHWYLQEVLSRHKLGAARKERKDLLKNGLNFKWDLMNVLAAFLPAHAAIQLEKREYHKTQKHPDISPGFLKSLTGREWEGIHKPIVTKLNDILYFNTIEMGLEELLRFADRNSMAHGVETRLPFLDHKLVEFVFSLPAGYKIHKGWTKWLLRLLMDKKLPDEIVWRKDKVGFEPPQKEWMENKILQDYIHEAKKKLVRRGILKQTVLNKRIQPRDAYTADNYDWRYLSAAMII